MVVNSSGVIPGIADAGELINWLDSSGIKFHEKLTIEKSPLGGAGLFYDNIDNTSGDIEVLRIPNTAKFDYKSLLDVLQQLKADPDTVAESKIIISVLELMEPQNETEILYSYFWGFYICYSLRKKSNETSVLDQFTPYLRLLTTTQVMNYPRNVDVTADPFIKKLVEKAENMQEKYETLQQSFTGGDISQLLPFDIFYQIYQGIKSRVLEIPYEAEEKGDFYVNVTLVPALDFANHSHKNNAYFDTDRSTGDIVLKLNSTVPTGKFEVTISYSPIESVQEFIETYGFIPKQLGFQLFELKFPDFNSELKATKHDLMCKWLRVLPQIQVVSGVNDEVYLNFFNNNLPLLFIPGLTYNENWQSSAIDSFNSTNQVELPPQMHEMVLSFLSYQEAKCDVINGVGPIAVLRDQEPVQLQTLLEDAGYVSDEAYRSLISRTIDFIIGFSKSALKKQPLMDPVDEFNVVMGQYLAYKYKILQLIIQRKPDSLILPLELSQSEWETSYRSLPYQIDVADLFS